jgi:LacI family transcriptional regulator
MRELLRLDPRPDGVFCYNDPLAIGAMNAILDAGLRVPEDVAVIGCGNLHYNGCFRVPLSSVDQRSAEIGKNAARILLDMVESKQPRTPQNCVLTPALVKRASTNRLAS